MVRYAAAAVETAFTLRAAIRVSYRDATGTNTMVDRRLCSASALALHLDCRRTYIGSRTLAGALNDPAIIVGPDLVDPVFESGTLVQSVEMQGLIAPALTLRPTLIELRRVLNAVEYSHSTLGDRRVKLLTPTRRYAAVLQFA